MAWAASELLGSELCGLVHPDERTLVESANAQAAKEQVGTAAEVRLRDRSGRWIWSECRFREVFAEHGESCRRTEVVVREITQKYLDRATLTMLSEIRELVADARDVDHAWERGLDRVARLGGFSLAIVWERAGEALESTTRWRALSLAPDLEAVDSLRLTELHSPVVAAWKRGTPTWVRSVADEYSTQRARAAVRIGLRAALIVPVGSVGEVSAVVELLVSDPDVSESVIKVAGTATTHLGEAIARKKVESDLAQAESELRLSFEGAALGMALVAPDGTFLRVNAALCRLLGRDAHELSSLDFQSITHPSDLAADVANCEAVLRGEVNGYEMEKRYLRGDGSVVCVLLSVSLVRDQSGKPLYFVAQAQDLSDRKVAERQLQQSEALFRAAFDGSAVGMAIVELTGHRPGRLVRANDAMADMARTSPEKLRGTSIVSVFASSERSDLNRALRQLASPDARAHHSEHRLDGDAERWARFSAAPVDHVDHDATRYVVVQLDDVTDRRLAQARLSHVALHDPLTGLPNRSLLFERIHQAQLRSERSENHIGVLFLDLDHFKRVNDAMGHGAGDQLLETIARRLEEALRPADTAARLGGDEFVLVCEDLPSNIEEAHAHVEGLTRRLHRIVGEPIDLDGTPGRVELSIGYVITRGSANTVQALLARADSAMYDAKELGGARSETLPV